MTQKEKSLERIRYIDPSGVSRFEAGGFVFDPEIPLPADINQDETFVESLSLESILAGILIVLAYDRDNRNAAYYRDLARAVKPDIRAELITAGVAQAKNQNFELAQEIFSALEGLFPGDPLVVLNIALLHDDKSARFRSIGRRGQADAEDAIARERYNQALLAEPPLADAFFNAGFFFMRKNEYAKAKNYFETYCVIGSDDLKKEKAREAAELIETRRLDDALFKNACDLVAAGDEAAGIDAAREFLEKYPDVWNAWFLLGWALRRLGRWQEAYDAFLRADDLCAADAPDEDRADILNEAAICAMELGEYDASAAFLSEAVALNCESVKIISNMGFLLLKRGEYKEAEKYFRIALELAPDDSLAEAALREAREKAKRGGIN